MCARRIRDRDTEDFLKRVEEHNSKQYTDAKNRSQLNHKQEHLNFSKESSDVTRKLPDTKFNGSSVQSNTSGSMMSDNILAYKSAYNYEKTFSPTKPNYNRSESGIELDPISFDRQHSKARKTYSVSEEDFLLLQRLKSGISSTEIPTKIPSRGRPREGGMPRHPIIPLVVNSEYEEEEMPPSLPARRIMVKTSSSAEDSSSSSDEDSPPLLPTRRFNGNDLPIAIAPSSQSPPVPPKKHGNSTLKGNDQKLLTEQRKVGPPPVPRKDQLTRNIPIDNRSSKINVEAPNYLTSIGKNRLTDSKKVQSGSQPKVENAPSTPRKVMASHLDYLDSVQKKEISPPRLISPRAQNQLLSPSKATCENQSETFVNSALKTMEKSTTLAKQKPRPCLPTKPVDLRDKNSSEDKVAAKNWDVKKEAEFATVKLRNVQKEKPIVPPKKSIPATSRLRALNAVGNGDSNGSPARHQKAAPRAEPLVKLHKVEHEEKESASDVPEALEKLRKLSKTKKSPAVPTRNISMPEALKKAEYLRQQKAKTQELPEARGSDENSFNSELSAVLAGSKAKPVTTNPRLISNKKHFQHDAWNSPKTVSQNDETTPTKELKHVNKTRAKGPKRKLPSISIESGRKLL